MAEVYSDVQSSVTLEELKAFEELITLYSVDDKKFRTFIDQKTYIAGNYSDLAKSGQFRRADLGCVIAEMSGSIGGTLLDVALNRCRKWGITASASFPDLILFNRKICGTYISNGLLENILHGKLFVLNKYQNSIVHLSVLDHENSEAAGSGFLFCSVQDDDHKLIITNKHVVSCDGNNGVGLQKISSVKRIAGRSVVYSHSEIILSECYDLAAVVVEDTKGAPSMQLERGYLLQDIITAGYPKMSVTQNNPLLFHGGQINGTVEDRIDGNFYDVIDANVAPGNSGGPVLNEIGGVVGVVSLSSMGRYVDGLEMHHLMIPAATITEFVNKEVLPKLAAN